MARISGRITSVETMPGTMKMLRIIVSDDAGEREILETTTADVAVNTLVEVDTGTGVVYAADGTELSHRRSPVKIMGTIAGTTKDGLMILAVDSAYPMM